MAQQLQLEQLARLGVNGATVGHVVAESDGDPNPGTRLRLIRDNRTAIVDPVVGNDSTQGYSVGSLWCNITARRVFWCASAAVGAALWAQVGGFTLPGGGDSGNAVLANLLSLRPGRLTLGDLMRYGPEGSPSAATIQYTRIFLTVGTVLDRMEQFVASGGTAGRATRMGLYDQAAPLALTGVPASRVAQTDSLVTNLDNGTFKGMPLTTAPTGGAGVATTYTVAVEGYYWVAMMANSAALKWPVTTEVYRPGFLAQLYFESGAGTTLPAVATPVTGGASSIAYGAAVLQGA